MIYQHILILRQAPGNETVGIIDLTPNNIGDYGICGYKDAGLVILETVTGRLLRNND